MRALIIFLILILYGQALAQKKARYPYLDVTTEFQVLGINRTQFFEGLTVGNKVPWDLLDPAVQDSIQAAGGGTVNNVNAPGETNITEISEKLYIKPASLLPADFATGGVSAGDLLKFNGSSWVYRPDSVWTPDGITIESKGSGVFGLPDINPGLLNFRSYGADGDSSTNTDDSTAWAGVYADANPGEVIYFPAGHYNFSLIDTLIIDKPLVLKGDGLGTFLYGSTSTGFAGTTFKVKKNLIVRDINVHKFGRAFRLDPQNAGDIDLLVFDNVGFKNCGKNIIRFESDAARSNGIENIYFYNNTAESLESGAMFDGKVKHVKLIDNTFKDLFLSTGSTALQAGSVLYEDSLAMIIAKGNTIDNVTASTGETHGIITYGQNVNITDNILRSVYNASGVDGEGIYTKSSKSIISANILNDAGVGNGCITIKANNHSDFNIVSNNQITTARSAAIYTNSSNIKIENNQFRVDGQSFVIAAPDTNLSYYTDRSGDILINNNHGSHKGLSRSLLYCQGGYREIITNNQFIVTDSVKAVYRHAVNAFSSNLKTKEIIISNNTFDLNKGVITEMSSGIAENGIMKIENNNFTVDSISTVSEFIILTGDRVTAKNNFIITGRGHTGDIFRSSAYMTNVSNNDISISGDSQQLINSQDASSSILKFNNNTIKVDSVSTDGLNYGVQITDSLNYFENSNNEYVFYNSAKRISKTINISAPVSTLVAVDNKCISNADYFIFFDGSDVVDDLIADDNIWSGTRSIITWGSGSALAYSDKDNWGRGVVNVGQYISSDSLFIMTLDFSTTPATRDTTNAIGLKSR